MYNEKCEQKDKKLMLNHAIVLKGEVEEVLGFMDHIKTLIPNDIKIVYQRSSTRKLMIHEDEYYPHEGSK